jgi:hypothetical protein
VTIVDTAGRSPVEKQAARNQIGFSDRLLDGPVFYFDVTGFFRT